MTMITAGHLGGYIGGGDPATFYPDLWEWLVRDRGVRSVLDVGCGDGVAIRAFARLGAAAVGVEGVPQADERILCHDFTEGPWPTGGSFLDGGYPGDFDLVWSCEFVEHVEAEYVPNFLTAFQLGRLLLMTHGEPGQPGWHHVNNQPADYWIGALSTVGFQLDEELTAQARTLARATLDPSNHFARSGLAFVRGEDPPAASATM